MNVMHYFDWTATTPICAEALEEYVKISKNIPGNPSSEHPLGQEAKTKLEESRKTVAEYLKTSPENVYFTSGGTESDNIVIQSLLNLPSKGTILVTSIEHSAVLENRSILEKSGWKFKTMPCPGGYLSKETLMANLDESVRMVCIMKVNNVTGTILDTCSLVGTVRNFEKTTGRKIHIHCDAVQAFGKIEFYPEKEDIDSAAFSAHKFCGPRGIGILYNRSKAVLPLSKGGGQERGIRPSTENLPAIAAMVTALSLSIENLNQNLETVKNYRNRLEDAVTELGYKLISPSCKDGKQFSPYILTFSTCGLPSQVYLRMLADKGYCLSAGSACSTNSRGKAESVLAAMNINPSDRMSSIRLSISYLNTEEEINGLIQAMKDIKNGR